MSGLEPWDEQLATTGTELIARRRKAAAMLQTELGRVFPALSGERHKVEIRYRTALGEATEATGSAGRAAARAARRAAARSDARRSASRRPRDRARRHRRACVRIARTAAPDRAGAASRRGAAGNRSGRNDAGSAARRRAVGARRRGVRENVLREIQGAEQVFLTSPEALPSTRRHCWTVREGDGRPGGGVAQA